MNKYDPKSIEAKWQNFWENHKTFSTPADATPENKCYILPQLPYPSGSGLHVGHAEVYAACDIYARYQRMKGKKVLQVFGLDSFGLPAENYAIKTNVHPKQTIDETGAHFVEQVKKLGVSVDWDRFVRSSDPSYYKFTQWFFLLMYERGLAYRKKQSVNWCETDKTVLANEQVEDGKCERCGTEIIQKEMEQWYLKITEYADKLLEGLDRIDWPEETKKRQRDWIGRSEGAIVRFPVIASGAKQFIQRASEIATSPAAPRNDEIEVFTTRPDTLFGATYMVLAPEGAYVQQLKGNIENWAEVEAYIIKTAKKTDLERQVNQEKTGVELKGVKAINPATGEAIPVWIADYVIATYGTGAIMAVPAHDERDFAFAKKFGFDIKKVVALDISTSKKGEELRNGIYGIWQKDKKILVLYEKKTDLYRLPGGTQEKNESDNETLTREFAEETGYTNVAVGECVGQVGVHFSSTKTKKSLAFVRKGYRIEVLSDEKKQIIGEDDDAYDYLWMSREEALLAFEKNKNSKIYPHDTGEGYLVQCYFDGENESFFEVGVAINSDFLNGLPTQEAKTTMIEWLEKEGKGKRKVQYRLRDWSVSRQRFWGAPVPMLINTETGETKPASFDDLPVELPTDVDFKPTGQSPLTYSEDFQKGVEEKYGKGWQREVDTLDTFMCSSWYFFRYLDPHNEDAFASSEALKKWMPVDFYLGGPEHVNGHLLYSRFFTKVLFDAGYIDFDEPFAVHRHQGLILGPDGRKMSKRWGNVVNPSDVVDQYGADTMRMYEMFMGPLEEDKPWDENGVRGIRRFLDRVWKLQEKLVHDAIAIHPDLEITINQTIKKVGDDLDSLGFNTAIAKMMELVNEMYKAETIPATSYKALVMILAPFAPHMAEELWQTVLGESDSIACAPWPTYDESKLVSDTITIAVQVNGKVRANIAIAQDAPEDDVNALALSQENVIKWMDGNEPKKVIYVKGKIVNIVV